MKFVTFTILGLALCGCGRNNSAFMHASGDAYKQSVNLALILATRNGSGTEYEGHSYGDSRAAAEDSHYHSEPSQYDGKGHDFITREHERKGEDQKR